LESRSLTVIDVYGINVLESESGSAANATSDYDFPTR
jgi:hypothetical protein